MATLNSAQFGALTNAAVTAVINVENASIALVLISSVDGNSVKPTIGSSLLTSKLEIKAIACWFV